MPRSITRDRAGRHRARSKGPIHTTNYAEIRTRALKVAQRLDRDGIKLGDRVATLAWNTWRHLEAWYGILGIGAIYHTVNPRLFPEQIAWIVNHAEDRVMMIDLTFVPLLEKLADKLHDHRALRRAHRRRAHAGDHAEERRRLRGLDRARSTAISPGRRFDENTAAGMCYTSGTTGNPKGVLYSHRSNVLHAMMAALPDAMGISCARRGAAGRADVPRQLLGARASPRR